MRKMFFTIVAVLFSTGIHAQGFMPWTEVMAKYDLDHDGGVSMEESKDHKLAEQFQGFQPWFADHFAELDLNGDGIVDSTELARMMKTRQWTDHDMANAFYKDLGFMPTNPANE